MAMKRCKADLHFYDSEKYNACPYCKNTDNEPDFNDIFDIHHPLEPHTILNKKYKVEKQLLETGFSILYIGSDLTLDQQCLIEEYFPLVIISNRSRNSNKIIPDPQYLSFFHEGLEKFIYTAKFLAKFRQHVGIMPILNFFEENSTAYIIMEYEEGYILENYIKNNKSHIPLDTTLQVIRSLLEILSAFHNQGLYHLDIKPRNIYITNTGKIKVIDFITAHLTEWGEDTIFFTHGYSPIELYCSKGELGSWTDVYSVAATCYEMITGQKPPKATDRVEKDTFLPPSQLNINIPVKIERALIKAMSVNARDRFQTADAFSQALNIKFSDEIHKLIVPSFILHQKIVDFLTSLPNIDDSSTQRALIYGAGLDEDLQHQIHFVGSATQFFQLLVPILSKYGKLIDGRNALESVLESAKKYVGQEKKEYCDKIIKELYSG